MKKLKDYFENKFNELKNVIENKNLQISSLQVEVEKIPILEKRVTDLETELKKFNYKNQQNEVALKAVVFKTKIPKNPTKSNVLEELNRQLENTKLSITDIDSIHDHRDKKGPLSIKFTNIKSKIKALTLKKKGIAITSELTKDARTIRTKAKELKSKGIITKVWDYKGNIYICRKDMNEKIQVDISKLELLETENLDQYSTIINA